MEAVIIQKYIHTTPRKLRLVADMVRAMEPEQALVSLKFTQKYAADDLIKAIQTAVASAKQKGMETVEFKSLEINQGPKMKRFRAGTRGRTKPFARKMSHIKIILTDDIKVKSQKLKVKNASQNLKVEGIENEVDEKEIVVDNSTVKPESKKGGRTELSK